MIVIKWVVVIKTLTQIWGWVSRNFVDVILLFLELLVLLAGYFGAIFGCFSQLQCKRGRREEEEDRGNPAELSVHLAVLATDRQALAALPCG